jgi:transcriptional regulator with XRE-family HTH domain
VVDGDTKAEWLRQVGRRVRQARIAADMTQVQLGLASGTSRRQVSRLERGASGVTLVPFWRIADAIAASPVFLLTGEGPPMPSPSAGAGGAR